MLEQHRRVLEAHERLEAEHTGALSRAIAMSVGIDHRRGHLQRRLPAVRAEAHPRDHRDVIVAIMPRKTTAGASLPSSELPLPIALRAASTGKAEDEHAGEHDDDHLDVVADEGAHVQILC